jgi:hypothetical protein
MTEADGFVYFDHDGQSRDGQTFSHLEADARIDHAHDTDSFYVSADQDGDYTFEAWRESGDVRPFVQVYDATTGQPLAANRPEQGANGSLVETFPLPLFACASCGGSTARFTTCSSICTLSKPSSWPTRV